MAKVKITETVLRDGHQSLLATRMRLSQMLPQLEALDAIGYKSLELGAELHLIAAFVSLMKIHGNVLTH